MYGMRTEKEPFTVSDCASYWRNVPGPHWLGVPIGHPTRAAHHTPHLLWFWLGVHLARRTSILEPLGRDAPLEAKILNEFFLFNACFRFLNQTKLIKESMNLKSITTLIRKILTLTIPVILLIKNEVKP